MIVNFKIPYRTAWGEQLAMRTEANGKTNIIKLSTNDGEHWATEVKIDQNIAYKYFILRENQEIAEWGAYRQLQVDDSFTSLYVEDYWRPQANEGNAFFAAAFADVIFKRVAIAKKEKITPIKGAKVSLRLHAAAVPQHLKVCVLGNCDALGNWTKPQILSEADFPTWELQIPMPTQQTIEYKYAFYDAANDNVVAWEEGNNRILQTAKANICRTDENFRYGADRWRGAGVAIPIFSLRTHQGLGIGEFTDLKTLTDWAVTAGMKLVQTLPVNDTIATRTWVDSYPYAAISVFALHPLYVNIAAIAKIKDKQLAQKLETKTNELNQLDTLDFEAVLQLKFEFFKALYKQEKEAFWKDKAVKTFMANNQDWLESYAAFCYLRDKNGTSNFNEWAEHQVFSDKVIKKICDSKATFFDEVALYYFIQYHADKQLKEATEYARLRGVVLKGDLPIGIYRYSADAWVAPHLYNMNGQAGAPPDDFAVAGQNWGFPTYNWQVMAEDNFAWWRQRMSKLSEYFDALRIDHILGFFRIWQIPVEQVEGTLGLFNPRLPYSRQELIAAGLNGHIDRFTKPYIRAHFLYDLFGDYAGWVVKEFLQETAPGVFELKAFCDTQVKMKALFAGKYADQKAIEKKMYSLVGEVLLIQEPDGSEAFNPRITIHTTRSYQELDHHNKIIINELYNDYYFVRHDEFWRQQALWKLPALLEATNMLICAEDLGMIPNSVPGVMRDLNIIALEIQRMPKGGGEFGVTNNYPYFSVCSPSCHDMSTIRGWWESDSAMAQRFYNGNMNWYGAAPHDCKPEIVETIVNQHLTSQSMWAIFPIQDLVGIDSDLRRQIASAEQINEPSNPQHYWRFRFHIPIEDLMQHSDLSDRIKRLVTRFGR